eukprot:1158871-Pelagomonas_calceolata.AAC.8
MGAGVARDGGAGGDGSVLVSAGRTHTHAAAAAAAAAAAQWQQHVPITDSRGMINVDHFECVPECVLVTRK